MAFWPYSTQNDKKLEHDIASDIRGLRGIIEVYYGNSDLVALNEFVKNIVVSSLINNC